MANPLIIGGRLTASGTGAVGIYCSGDTTIAHIDSTTAITSIEVAAGVTAAVIGNQFDPTATAGAGTIEYLYGDRAVWDALNYQMRHANDIDNAAGIHHTLDALDALYISTVLTDSHILVGNASNIATDVAMSGDVTIDNTGATTIGAKKVDASNIELADTKLLIGGVDGAAHEQSMSADATIANTGALTLATVNADVGTYGDATNVAQVTVNAKGLITAVTEVAITILTVINTYNETQTATSGLIYYLANIAAANTVRAYVNGIRQPVADTDANSDVVTFSVAPLLNDTLLFDYELELA